MSTLTRDSTELEPVEFAVDLSFWNPNLHPRDSHGRFRDAWGLVPAVKKLIDGILKRFHPLTARDDEHFQEYTDRAAAKVKKTSEQAASLSYLTTESGWDDVQSTLRAGKDDISHVRHFDAMKRPLQDDLIVTHVMGADAFGLPPERIGEVEEWTGKLVSDKGFLSTNLGTPYKVDGPHITVSLLTPRGTQAVIPGGSREVILDREQPWRIMKVEADGHGGVNVYAVVEPTRATGRGPARNLGKALPAREHAPAIAATPEEMAKRGLGPDGNPIPPAAAPGAPPAGAGAPSPAPLSPPVGRLGPEPSTPPSGNDRAYHEAQAQAAEDRMAADKAAGRGPAKADVQRATHHRALAKLSPQEKQQPSSPDAGAAERDARAAAREAAPKIKAVKAPAKPEPKSEPEPVPQLEKLASERKAKVKMVAGKSAIRRAQQDLDNGDDKEGVADDLRREANRLEDEAPTEDMFPGEKLPIADMRQRAKEDARALRQTADALEGIDNSSEPGFDEPSAAPVKKAVPKIAKTESEIKADEKADALTQRMEELKRARAEGRKPEPVKAAEPSAPAAPAKVAKKAAPSPSERPQTPETSRHEDLRTKARVRHQEVATRKPVADAGAELEELVAKKATNASMAEHVRDHAGNLDEIKDEVKRAQVKRELEEIADDLEKGRRPTALKKMAKLEAKYHINREGKAGDMVPFDPAKHESIGGVDIPEGTEVRIVRAGTSTSHTEDNSRTRLDKPLVRVVHPEEGKKLQVRRRKTATDESMDRSMARPGVKKAAPAKVARPTEAEKKDVAARAAEVARLRNVAEAEREGKKVLGADQFGPEAEKKQLDAVPTGIGEGGKFRGGEKLSDDDREKLQRYLHSWSASGYSLGGKRLRKLPQASSQKEAADEMIASLDRGMAESKLDRDITVFRGDRDVARFVPDFEGDLTGKVLHEPSFRSTSTSEDHVLHHLQADAAEEQFRPKPGTAAIMRIKVPKGSSALGVSGADQESEVLLDRDTDYRVIADHGLDAKGIRRLDVEVVPKGSKVTPDAELPPEAPAVPAATKVNPNRIRANGKIASGHLREGDQVLVYERDGHWRPAYKKGDSTVMTVTGREPGAKGRQVITGKTPDGKEIRITRANIGRDEEGVPGHQTFIAHVEKPAKVAPVKAVKAVKKAVPSAPEAPAPAKKALPRMSPERKEMFQRARAHLKERGIDNPNIDEVLAEVETMAHVEHLGKRVEGLKAADAAAKAKRAVIPGDLKAVKVGEIREIATANDVKVRDKDGKLRPVAELRQELQSLRDSKARGKVRDLVAKKATSADFDAQIRSAKQGPEAVRSAAPLDFEDQKTLIDIAGPDSRTALQQYRGALFNNIQQDLRAGGVSETVTQIDSAMDHSKLTDDVVVHRGVSRRGFERDLGRKIEDGENLRGVKFTPPTYTSTTSDEGRGRGFGNKSGEPGVVLRILAPKGTKGISLSRGEEELLLERGLTYEIVADHGIQNHGKFSHRMLDVRVVPGPAKKAAPAATKHVDDRIRAAFEQHKLESGWAPLASVRKKLSDLSREDQDRALARLATQPGVQIAPWDNAKQLSKADRAESLRLGGQDNHVIRFESEETRKAAEKARQAAKQAAKAAESPTETNLSKLTVAQLREQVKSRKLLVPPRAVRADLIRILEGDGPSGKHHFTATPGIDSLREFSSEGHVERKYFSDGKVAAVALLEGDNGRKVVRKRHQAGWNIPPEEQADAENLTSRVGRDVTRASVPAVYQHNESTIYEDHIDGKIGDKYTEPEAKELARSVEAGRMAIMDAIIGNQDRHTGNWMVDREGRVHGIDHGTAWFQQPKQRADGSWPAAKPHRYDYFSRHWVTDSKGKWKDKIAFSRRELDRMRLRLVRMRTEFAMKGRLDWYDGALGRLDEIIERATLP